MIAKTKIGGFKATWVLRHRWEKGSKSILRNSTANDIRKTKLVTCDVIFLNDVLHYLPEEDQYHFLERSLEALDKNGILFIRDGIKKEEETSYKFTKITEILSTKVFGFNKSEHPLEFISEHKMRDFAKANNLTLEKINHSKTTSNVLLILRKS